MILFGWFDASTYKLSRITSWRTSVDKREEILLYVLKILDTKSCHSVLLNMPTSLNSASDVLKIICLSVDSEINSTRYTHIKTELKLSAI